MKNNVYQWLTEEDTTASMPTEPQETQDSDDMQVNPEDMEQKEDVDFESWKQDFMDLAVRYENEDMISSLKTMRNKEGLSAVQRKFVEDNYQIALLRRDPSILKASKQIRQQIKQELDKTNPAKVVMEYITLAMNSEPQLYEYLIKIISSLAFKGDLHRKFIAALTGSIQVGNGGDGKDLSFQAREYEINFSTRVASQFGDVSFGFWKLTSSDPEMFLKPDEVSNMEKGSPEEKDVIQRKLIIKSFGEKYKRRSFIFNIVNADGTIISIGWDLGNSILDGYQAGKIVARMKQNEDNEIMFSSNGDKVILIDYDIVFLQDSDEVDDFGKPIPVEVVLFSRENGSWLLKADQKVLSDAANVLSGFTYKENPFNGNPSDLVQMQNSVLQSFKLFI